VQVCTPTTTTITSFDPLVVDGGVGTTLNIHGYQFGASRGNGNLYFYKALLHESYTKNGLG
jgi:hypothetical protein